MTWTTGPVTIDDDVIVLGQYDDAVRWNGFLCPFLDALTCVEVVAALNALNDTWGEPPLVLDFEADGTMAVNDLTYPGDEPERIEPDADGLYALGSYGWVWQAAA